MEFRYIEQTEEASAGVAGQAGAGRARSVWRDRREAVAGEAGGGLRKGRTLSTDLINQAMAQALQNAAPLKYNAATKLDMAEGVLASGLELLSA